MHKVLLLGRYRNKGTKMYCSNCGASDQNKLFCTSCGNKLSVEIPSVSGEQTQTRKGISNAGLWTIFISALVVLVVYFYAARASTINSLKEFFPNGTYRAALAACPGSGIDIYWVPIQVILPEDDAGRTALTYEYTVDYDVLNVDGELKAKYPKQPAENILDCEAE